MALKRNPLAYRIPGSRGAVGSLTQLARATSTNTNTAEPSAQRRSPERVLACKVGVLLIGQWGLTTAGGYHRR